MAVVQDADSLGRNWLAIGIARTFLIMEDLKAEIYNQQRRNLQMTKKMIIKKATHLLS